MVSHSSVCLGASPVWTSCVICQAACCGKTGLLCWLVTHQMESYGAFASLHLYDSNLKAIVASVTDGHRIEASCVPQN